MVVLRLARRIRQNAGTHTTPSQLSALSTLDRCGPVPLGQLAASEQIGPSTLTKIVAALEAADLVERTPAPSDRRVALVGVTRKGRRLLDAGRRRSRGLLAERMASLTASERRAIERAIPILEKLLEAARR